MSRTPAELWPHPESRAGHASLRSTPQVSRGLLFPDLRIIFKHRIWRGWRGEEEGHVERNRADELHPTGNNNRSVFSSARAREGCGVGPGFSAGAAARDAPARHLEIPHRLWGFPPPLLRPPHPPLGGAKRILLPGLGQGQHGLEVRSLSLDHTVWGQVLAPPL